jgi:hypothetical protein
MDAENPNNLLDVHAENLPRTKSAYSSLALILSVVWSKVLKGFSSNRHFIQNLPKIFGDDIRQHGPTFVAQYFR